MIKTNTEVEILKKNKSCWHNKYYHQKKQLINMYGAGLTDLQLMPQHYQKQQLKINSTKNKLKNNSKIKCRNIRIKWYLTNSNQIKN